jgi:adenosylmethionine-8-amino-7-oxononanoate aminotransferase
MPHHVLHGDPQVRPTIVSASGVFLFDAAGKSFLDAIGGAHVVTIGHGVEEIAESVADQIRKVSFVGNRNFLNEPQIELAELVAQLSPPDLDWVYFVSGGAEGAEMALQLAYRFHTARGAPRRTTVIGREISYHGATLGALSMGGHTRHRGSAQPYLLDFPRIAAPYCYRCPFAKEFPTCELACAQDLATTIERLGPDTVSAFVAEPVVGATGGAIVPPPGYYELIRTICDEYGVLFISDEVVTGFGRTGAMFGIEHWGVVPDLMFCSKGIASGYAPLGALVVHGRVVETLRAAGDDVTLRLTHSGNPVSCAAGLAVQRYVDRHRLVARAGSIGGYLLDLLDDLADRQPLIGQVRGRGLLIGLEIVRNMATREPFPRSARVSERIAAEAISRGLVVATGSGAAGSGQGDHIILSPPYTVLAGECDLLVALLEESLATVSASPDLIAYMA